MDFSSNRFPDLQTAGWSGAATMSTENDDGDDEVPTKWAKWPNTISGEGKQLSLLNVHRTNVAKFNKTILAAWVVVCFD